MIIYSCICLGMITFEIENEFNLERFACKRWIEANDESNKTQNIAPPLEKRHVRWKDSRDPEDGSIGSVSSAQSFAPLKSRKSQTSRQVHAVQTEQQTRQKYTKGRF